MFDRGDRSEVPHLIYGLMHGFGVGCCERRCGNVIGTGLLRNHRNRSVVRTRRQRIAPEPATDRPGLVLTSCAAGHMCGE
ncbi:hypothetical protein SCWH03_19510 [Streptomyces pacificus]|uniref:Uncharacterized protein n=1 Tax=Streptomyces pacificus TaxID=2705029 RepID=A0A6A0AS30_9ACTN|nr:hypothetical protein SCWH03_19510 [Streptomyces pacificus]